MVEAQMDLVSSEGNDVRDAFMAQLEITKNETDVLMASELPALLNRKDITAKRYNRWLRDAGCKTGERRSVPGYGQQRVVVGVKRKVPD